MPALKGPGLHSFIHARNQRSKEDNAEHANAQENTISARRQAIANLSRMSVPKISLGGASKEDRQVSAASHPKSTAGSPVSQSSQKKLHEGTEDPEHEHWDGFSTDMEDFTETSWSERASQSAGTTNDQPYKRTVHQAGYSDNLLENYANAEKQRIEQVSGANEATDEDAEDSGSGSSDMDGDDFREEDPTITLNMDKERALWAPKPSNGSDNVPALAERPKSSSNAAGVSRFVDRPNESNKERARQRNFESDMYPENDGEPARYYNPGALQAELPGGKRPGDEKITKTTFHSSLSAGASQPDRVLNSQRLFENSETYSSSQSGEDDGRHSMDNHTSPNDINKDTENPHHPRSSSTARPGLAAYNIQPTELDFPLETLEKMSYADLKAQHFDHDPNATLFQLPQEFASSDLSTQMSHVSTLNVEQQSEFCNSLGAAEWEEAGDWFLDQFSSMLTRMKDARRDKRKLASEFEAEIEKRDASVRKKGEDIDDVLYTMKRGGQEVLSGKTA
ncbi:MAG: hypothetical protein M4579_003748 [Chaenotheca gracillima]|nr:MAG: hypothetical protein M4579_003748 [Chaenotheca gracillima]